MALSRFQIGIIGLGNLGQALLNNFLPRAQSKILLGHSIKDLEYVAQNRSSCNFNRMDNRTLAQNVDMLVLAVNSGNIAEVCLEIRPKLKKQTLIIAVTADVSMANYQLWLGQRPIVKALLPSVAQIGTQIVPIYHNSLLNNTQLLLVNHFFHPKLLHWVDNEAELDKVKS